MGYDIYGHNPASPQGRYFRANAYWWNGLTDVLFHVAPDLCRKMEGGLGGWQHNGGSLDAADARALAAALDERLTIGLVDAHLARRKAFADTFPRCTCPLCGGSGLDQGVQERLAADVDPDNPFDGPSEPRAGGGPCMFCGGKGTLLHSDAPAVITRDFVAEFAAFLRDSGGFAIW